MDRSRIWEEIDTERTALAHQLASIDAEAWQTESLCTGLTVREVLAHLTVSGTLSGSRWFLGVLRARFDFDQQVVDRLREQLGFSPLDTLNRFRATVGSRVSPHFLSWRYWARSLSTAKIFDNRSGSVAPTRRRLLIHCFDTMREPIKLLLPRRESRACSWRPWTVASPLGKANRYVAQLWRCLWR